jgi:copper homeostasis protein
MKSRILIEVCTGSVSDSVTAFEAGADRIELNSAVELGGLSPSPGMLSLAVEWLAIPVIAMVRPRPGGFVYSLQEKTAMQRDIDFFLSRGAAGIAVGALTPEFGVDTGFIRDLKKLTGESQLVFHRAFDMLPLPLETACILADSGVDRILTSGGRRTAIAGQETIRNLITCMGNRLEILPGSGINSGNAAALVKFTGCRAVHGSFSEAITYSENESGVLPSEGVETSACEIRETIKALS